MVKLINTGNLNRKDRIRYRMVKATHNNWLFSKEMSDMELRKDLWREGRKAFFLLVFTLPFYIPYRISWKILYKFSEVELRERKSLSTNFAFILYPSLYIILAVFLKLRGIDLLLPLQNGNLVENNLFSILFAGSSVILPLLLALATLDFLTIIHYRGNKLLEHH